MSLTSYALAQVLRVLPRSQISAAVGHICDTEVAPSLSKPLVDLYARAYKVNLAESSIPSEGFRSFDAFFTRTLTRGARAIEQASVVSPSDGRLDDVGRIHDDGKFHIKGQLYDLAELIGDVDDVNRYKNGQFAIIYLSPRDYHRVHSPMDGQITMVRSLPGDLFPVNSVGTKYVPLLFARNRRVAIVIDSEALGRVTVVMVGAMIVGRITVSCMAGRDVPIGNHILKPAHQVAKGEEIGIFHLGSTVVMFFEKCVGSLRLGERPVKLGQSMLSVDT